MECNVKSSGKNEILNLASFGIPCLSPAFFSALRPMSGPLRPHRWNFWSSESHPPTAFGFQCSMNKIVGVFLGWVHAIETIYEIPCLKKVHDNKLPSDIAVLFH